MSRTPRDELRATAQGETSRAKARCHELGIILTVLGESVPDAINTTKDAETLAIRLQGIVLAGSSTLNELAQIASRLAAP